MKKLIYFIVILSFILCSKFYTQNDFMDKSFRLPNLQENQFVLETPDRIIDPEELDSLITTTMGTYHIPGLTALIVKHDSIVWSKNYGYANVALTKPIEDSTMFHMASISKTVMITALMQLWEDDLFDLEDNINYYLQPEFQVHNPYYPNDTITFKMLMTHTSSIYDFWAILTPLRCCGDSPVPFDYFLINYFTPGGIYYNTYNFLNQSPSDTLYEYSNVGSSILAFLVQKLSGVPFPKYCRDSIFTPLNMNSTSWFLEGLNTNYIATPYEWSGGQYVPLCHQGWPPYPAISLRTNKIELEHFLSAYMNNGIYNGYSLLYSSTIDTMLRVYKYVPQALGDWGLIWYRVILNDMSVWGHTGSWWGTRTSMFFYPEEDWGIIIFMNIWPADLAFRYLNEIIMEYAHNVIITSPLSISVTDGWNMVSVPGVNPAGQGVTTWWPGLTGNVFNYAGGYNIVTTTTPTEGYWMKHMGAQVYNYPAIEVVTHDPIAGVSGWNLIGGYENFATVSLITTNPAGLQSGPIYKYSGGYQVATTLDPGYGYWINLTGAGQIILPEVMAKGTKPVEYFPEGWGKIIFTDASGIIYTLYAVTGEVDISRYELPPAPPQEMFDIRYSSGRIAEDINGWLQSIDMSGVAYPLTVKVEGMNIRIMDETGKRINENLKDGENIVIADAQIQKLMVSGELMPTVYALQQNYPNPFNPTTTISFSLPVKSQVRLIVYNALGELIMELVNEVKESGSYSVELNAWNIPSGVYFYRLQAGDFVQVKKMMLLK